MTKEQVRAARDAAELERRKDAVTKGLGHVLRRRLLAEIPGPTVKTGRSPNELHKALNEALTNVSYHVRMLSDLGLIQQVDTAQRRGALEHYYRKTELGELARKEDQRIARTLAPREEK